MGGEVLGPAIRFSLNYATGGFAFGGAGHQQFADTLARDDKHRLCIKLARQFLKSFLAHSARYCQTPLRNSRSARLDFSAIASVFQADATIRS
jgi:hypothetical protein